MSGLFQIDETVNARVESSEAILATKLMCSLNAVFYFIRYYPFIPFSVYCVSLVNHLESSHVAQSYDSLLMIKALLNQTIWSIPGSHSINKLTSSDLARCLTACWMATITHPGKDPTSQWPDHLCAGDISDWCRPNCAKEAFKPVPRGVFQALSGSILPTAAVLRPDRAGLNSIGLCFLSGVNVNKIDVLNLKP